MLERSPCPGRAGPDVRRDDLLERHEASLLVADRDEARQHLRRDLHAREGLDVRAPGRAPHGQRQRQVGDVREGPPEARPPAASAPGRSGGRSARRRRARSAWSRSSRLRRRGRRARPAPGAGSIVQAARVAARLRADDLVASALDLVCAGVRPSWRGRLDAGVDLVVQARDADHEELVEVGRSRSRRTSPAPAAGSGSSSASCRTRSLNSIHDSSRLKYSAGSCRSGSGAAAGASWPTTTSLMEVMLPAVAAPLSARQHPVHNPSSASSKQTPSRSPPFPISSGWPSAAPPRRASRGPRAAAARARRRAEAAATLRPVPAEQRLQSAPIEPRRRATGPTRRRSDVALPPTATAAAASGGGDALKRAAARCASHRARRRRRIAARGARRRATPEPMRIDADHSTPPWIVPTAISVEPPPTSTTPTWPATGASRSVRVAPTEGQPRLLLPVEDRRPRCPRGCGSRRHSSRRLSAPRIAAVATARDRVRAEPARPARAARPPRRRSRRPSPRPITPVGAQLAPDAR